MAPDTAAGPWRAANNGTGKRIWFLHRTAPAILDRYHWDARGRNLVRYAKLRDRYPGSGEVEPCPRVTSCARTAPPKVG